MLSESACKQIQDLISRYPQKRSALIPSLHLVQKELGYISQDAMREVAEIFELSPNEVHEVTSFYTMFHRKPVGKYVIHVCDSVICWMEGHESLVEHLSQRLGINLGETTGDGLFTLLPVCCIGYCDRAPAILINKMVYGPLTIEKLDDLLEKLKAQA